MEERQIIFEHEDCINCYFYASGFCTLNASEPVQDCDDFENVFDH